MTSAAFPRAAAAHRKFGRNAKRRHGSDDFRIEILFPGAAIGSDDSGIGTIGRIDDARITPGTLVAMHPHRDDEILTYLRSGRVEHRDTVGHTEIISPTRLMLMGAGAEFQHEEQVSPDSEPLRALQIFLRPAIGGLPAKVQFHDFGQPTSRDEWRLVAGPEADAPLRIRSRSWVRDVRLSSGAMIELPELPEVVTRLVYVFSGEVTIGDDHLTAGESLLVGPEPARVTALAETDLVSLETDVTAPVFKRGMFSGNVLG